MQVEMSNPQFEDSEAEPEDLILQSPQQETDAFRIQLPMRETKFEELPEEEVSNNTIEKLGMLSPPEDSDRIDIERLEMMEEEKDQIYEKPTQRRDYEALLISNDEKVL